MNYIRLYNQHTDYEADTTRSEIKAPVVCYCDTEDELHYTQYFGSYIDIEALLNGHEAQLIQD